MYEVFAYYFNLYEFSNGVVLWLDITPADVFVYVFLPPLLMDSALRLDLFMLNKVGRGVGDWGGPIHAEQNAPGCGGDPGRTYSSYTMCQ